MSDKKGFSLIEMVIAVAVMSIVMLGAAYMVSNGQKAIQTVNSSEDFDTLSALVRNSLSSPQGCVATLNTNGQGGKNSLTLNLASSTPVPVGTLFMPDGVTPLLTNGRSTADFQSVALSVKGAGTISQSPALCQMAQFTVTATRNPGSYMGANSTISINELIPMCYYGLAGTYNCVHGTAADMSDALTTTPSGSNIQGTWLYYRVGALISNPVPPPGTIDIWQGAGSYTGAPASVNCPVSGCQITYGTGGWTGTAMVVH